MSVFPVLLYEYLMRERYLPIRSFGVVFVEKQDPFFDVAKGVFLPPRYVYTFKGKEEVSHEDVRSLEDFLAQKMDTTVRAVSEQLCKWQESIEAYCTEGKTYSWLGIGEFYRVADGRLSFRSLYDDHIHFFSEVFVLNRKTEIDENKQTYTQNFFTDASNDATTLPLSSVAQNLPLNEDMLSPSVSQLESTVTEMEPPPQSPTIPLDNTSSPEVFTEFVELDAPERFSVLQKIFIIVLLLGAVVYIFLHLFFNDFSFHSYAR